MYSLLRSCDIEKIASLSDAIKHLQPRLSSIHGYNYQSDILYNECDINHIDVRRQFVFEDALKEAKKQKFPPEKCFKVCSCACVMIIYCQFMCAEFFR